MSREKVTIEHYLMARRAVQAATWLNRHPTVFHQVGCSDIEDARAKVANLMDRFYVQLVTDAAISGNPPIPDAELNDIPF